MTLFYSRLPFACRGQHELAESWSTWIGTVFYEILPGHGFEIREEQIYTAFQIATAMQQRGVHLAEAGLGTGKTKAANRHHEARDFIICDHEFFFADLWSREEREADGQRPFLPEYSGVNFDEGHKIFLPASRAAGKKLVRAELEQMLLRLEKVPDARDALLEAIVAVEDAAEAFYRTLAACLSGDRRTERLTVQISPKLKKEAQALLTELRRLEFELETERSLYTEHLSPALLRLYDQRIAAFSEGMRLIANDTGETVAWLKRADESLRVLPRGLEAFFAEHLFKRRIPVIFSSATLSTGGDFRYLAAKLGLDNRGPVKLTASSVGSPFVPEKQVLVYLPEEVNSAYDQLLQLLTLSRGRALVLTAGLPEVRQIRAALKDELVGLPFKVLWEDQADRAYLLQTFKQDLSSVLVGSSFWEGIDVPGEALSLLVIWSLPFPPSDPLLDSLRRAAVARGADPAEAVDYPEMALRLKQGCGRLIRTRTDRGVIAVLAPVRATPWEKDVLAVLPEGAPLTKRMADVEAFFARTYSQSDR